MTQQYWCQLCHRGGGGDCLGNLAAIHNPWVPTMKLEDMLFLGTFSHLLTFFTSHNFFFLSFFFILTAYHAGLFWQFAENFPLRAINIYVSLYDGRNRQSGKCTFYKYAIFSYTILWWYNQCRKRGPFTQRGTCGSPLPSLQHESHLLFTPLSSMTWQRPFFMTLCNSLNI